MRRLMMTKERDMKKILAAACTFVVVSFYGLPAFAATCNDIGCTGTVRQLLIWQDDKSDFMAKVRLDTDAAPTSGCTLDSGAFWRLDMGFDNALRALLAAYLSGSEIFLRRTSGDSTCTISYVRLE